MVIFNLQSGYFDLKSGQYNLESGYFDLKSGQFNLESGYFDLESGQFDLQSKNHVISGMQIISFFGDTRSTKK